MLPQLPPWIHTVFAMFLVIMGFVGQNVTIVFWTESKVSQYGILVLCGTSFFLIFGILLTAFAIRNRDWTAFYPSDESVERKLFLNPWKRKGGFKLTHAQILALVGILNSWNGFLIVYASPSKRTPPLIQTIFQNAGILFSIPFSKMALGDRKKYSGREPIIAAAVIVTSVLTSLAPTVYAIAKGTTDSEFGGAKSIAWATIFICGLIPGAAYNVYQQLYLLRAGLLEDDVTKLDTTKGILRALFWSNMAHALTHISFFWVDLLPWFGWSKDISVLLSNTIFSISCSLGGQSWANKASKYMDNPPALDDCSVSTPVFAFLFITSYTVAYVGGGMLNRESSVLQQLSYLIATVATAAVWLIPNVNPNPSGTPVWSVLISLVLSIIGGWMWKTWESKIPAPQQFAVATPLWSPEGVPMSYKQMAKLYMHPPLDLEGDDTYSDYDSEMEIPGRHLDAMDSYSETATINAPLLPSTRGYISQNSILRPPRQGARTTPYNPPRSKR